MTTNLAIRPLNIGDLATCEANFPSPASVSYKEQISRQSPTGYSLYGLFYGGQLAAMIHLRRQGPKDPQVASLYPHPLLGNLYVQSDFRKRGFAQQLIAHCESVLGSEGREEVGLIVSTANFPALTLYESLGYKSRQQFPARPGRDIADRLYYSKAIVAKI